MKSKLRIACRLVLFVILFILCSKLFRYILVDDTKSFTRLTFHEMYEQDNIDVLFVGSSHCQFSFNPAILDERLECNTFNAGTANQHLDGSYMIIKEAAKHNDIKHIYLEMYCNVAYDRNYKDRDELTQVYIISDYLKPSLDKAKYLLEASAKKHYFNSFIVARRNWERLFDFEYIKNVIARKSTDIYKEYLYDYANVFDEKYCGKGYTKNNHKVENWDYFYECGMSPYMSADVSNDWYNSLQDIIRFCNERDIELTLVTAPMPNYCVESKINYDVYDAIIEGIITGYNVEYYDFNLCKEEYFPNTSELFQDDDHLNSYGAEKFCNLFAEVMNGQVDADEVFYDSFEEKLSYLAPTVFGICYDEEEGTRHCRISSTHSEGMQYKIVFKDEWGNETLIQDFSTNSLFEISSNIEGECEIDYRIGTDSREEFGITVKINEE